ncbi:uncharacterized protein HKW66_Vig0079980 [Vigna angularis]|uniref:Uncharacterized protein n=1 Tax=Phaseolus angularis TaxID=3914 RepID=A0A8T0KHR7_PHAAN|nr:uncharacterized protein HKW66_Vig0079980 [Vigna angularis]
MSAMVSALTHVVTGEVPTSTDSAFLHDNHAVTPHVPSSASITPSLSSSSNYVLGTSSHKRAREQDAPCFSQTSSMPRRNKAKLNFPENVTLRQPQFSVSNSSTSLVSISTSTDPAVHTPSFLPSQGATNVYEYFQLSGFPTNLYDDRTLVTSSMASHLHSSSSSSSSSSAFVTSSQDTSLSSFYSTQIPPWSASAPSSSSSG